MRSFPLKKLGWSWVAMILYACLLPAIPHNAFAEDETQAAVNSNQRQQTSAADTDDSPERLIVEVQSVRIENFSSLDVIRGQLVLKLKITNNTSHLCRLNSADFSATLNGKSTEFNPAVTEPLLVGEPEVRPGKSVTGHVAFNLTYTSLKEPTMEFRWKYGDTVIQKDLNKEARRTTKIEVSRVGPRDCLAIVEFHRVVDHLGIWLLTEQFQKLKRGDAERVLLSVHPVGSPPRLYSLKSSIGGWLASVQSGYKSRRVPFANSVPAPVQFESFFVVGISSQTASSGNYARYSTVFKYQKDRDRAVAESLKQAYNHVPINDVLADLAHPEPGVQLAAIESNLDRLSEKQLKSVIDQSKKRSANFQIRLAQNLFRVPFPSVATTLVELVQHDNNSVSEAAVESLVKSVSPNSVVTLNRIWRDAKDDLALRKVIVSKVLQSKDHRHSRLLTDYAIGQLRRFSAPVDAASEQAIAEDKSNASKPLATASSARYLAATKEAQSLAKLLVFLQPHDHDQLLSVTRECVLKISNPAVQDVLMGHLLRSPGGAADELAAAYIQQRLPTLEADTPPADGLSKEQAKSIRDRLGPRSGPRNRIITSQFLQTVRRFPDAGYTDRLLTLIDEKAVSGSRATDTFRSAIRCAGYDQLTKLAEDFEALSKDQLSHLLKALAAIDHPQWLEIAALSLREDAQAQYVALAVLSTNATPESIQVIVDFLDDMRVTVEQKHELDRKTQTVLARVFAQLQKFTYPEARRVVNRCYRSDVLKLSELADNSIDQSRSDFFRSTPYQAEFKSIYDLRKANKHTAALKAINDLLTKEPFYTSLYVSRASLYLRTDRPELAMKDLQTARRQNPEDDVIRSITAICLVRLGEVEQAIAEIENQLVQIPDLPTVLRRDAIYNTACVYGRASEVAGNTEVQARYVRRAMKLLKECSERKEGFDDPEHLLDDPDLKMLHDHPDWQAIVNKVRENEKNSAKS